jgi:hypothetical protein
VLVAQRINDFVTTHGKPVCDRCIMGALKLTAHAHSAQITGALGTTSDFTRKMGTWLTLQERKGRYRCRVT